jgi:YegS/Rv2252/BmrU family lipid kinase
MPKSILVVINPGSGGAQPVLHTLNSVFRPAGVQWDVRLTQAFGDAKRLAAEAAAGGVDYVGIYGGDGSVMEAATGLLGTGVPLVVLPGGTANVFSKELGIPQNLEKAAALVTDASSQVRQVDMGLVNGEHYFVLRFATGFEAEMTDLADRELKNKVGKLAYSVAGVRALKRPLKANYRFTIDGREETSNGVTAMIANTGNLGVPGIRIDLADGSDVSDGLLDVMVLSRRDHEGWLKLLTFTVTRSDEEIRQDLQDLKVRRHWQGRKIRIEADPPQKINLDGEIIGETPAEVEIVPQAMQVLVPGA